MPFLDHLLYEPGDPDTFPHSIPSLASLDRRPLTLNPGVTFLVGENGSGKSTLLEGIADRWGFAREGGPRTERLFDKEYWSDLGASLELRGTGAGRPMDGFFLRAESFFNFATMIDELENDVYTRNGYFGYGGKSLHQQSHGESFLALFMERFGEHGLYLLDEPEAALSPSRQLAFLVRMHDLVRAHCQFIIATHSPILLGYPGATIYQLDDDGLEPVEYEQTSPYVTTKSFLDHRERQLSYLLSDDE